MNSGVKFPLYKKIIRSQIDDDHFVTKNFRSYEIALQSARDGDIDAAFYLSKCASAGFFWLLKAAESGHALAQFNIGKAYYYGDKAKAGSIYGKLNLERDIDKAMAWLQKSADVECLHAQAFLASISLDKIKIEETAKKGNMYSRFNMGVLCLDTDISQAFNWFNQAFERPYLSRYSWLNKVVSKDRNMYAQYNMGVMCDNGLGVRTNKKKAFYYYLSSAEKGFYMAENNLGVMFAEGEISTSVNMTQARKWIKRALETDMSDSGIPLANWQKYAI
jgi:TPR repeat protein